MAKPRIRNEIRFLLNGEDVALADVAPDETLLDYLRLRRSLRGTKEGCAEGDCGACTVLVGRLSAGKLIYEGVNACIRFVGSLDGCHVVTVEHLRGREGGLHPVQQAMVDFHGSQCGFCTPGFVMSLYALWMSNATPSNAEIEKALQGNLCRCTGYEAIVRAAMAISSYGHGRKGPAGRRAQGNHRQACRDARRQPRRDRGGQAAAAGAGIPRRSGGAVCGRAGSQDRGGLDRRRPVGDQAHARHFAGYLHRRARRAEDHLRGRWRHPDRRRRHLFRGVRDARQAHPAARSAVRPHRRRAGAQHGNDRRQHRQRLADRRHAAAADRARRHAYAAQGQASGARSCWRISSSPTASRTESRANSSRRSRCRCRQRIRISPSTRSPSGATRTSRQRSARSI